MKVVLVFLIALGAFLLWIQRPGPSRQPARSAAPVSASALPDRAAYGLRAPLDRTRAVLGEVGNRAADEP